MRRLIWGFAGRTYHIDGNLMSQLCCFLKFKMWVSQHVSCFVDGGNLLKHPSAAMTKLINSVDKASCRFTEAEREKALQRPVMSFICQRHDLDGLQLAMRQALRKATCRVFAMQVMFLGQLPANIAIRSTLIVLKNNTLSCVVQWLSW